MDLDEMNATKRRWYHKQYKKFKSYFREYCNATSIHGFRYFGEKRTYVERGWWFMIFVVCLSVCGYFILGVYNKWENSPVIVSFATKETPIYEIPFPAVTICPETKSDQSEYSHSEMIRKFIKRENITLDEYQRFSYMNLICDFPLPKFLDDGDRFNETFDNYYYTDNEFYNFLYNVTPTPFEQLVQCIWMTKKIPCKELFQTVITDEGICYTFNMLEHTEIFKETVLSPDIPFSNPTIPNNVSWTLDHGYEYNEDVDTYPRRALFSGAKNGLNVILLETLSNADHTCKFSIQGYKVSLHTPMRVPRPSHQYFRVPLNEIVLTAVQPVMITTSETVKDFKPHKRECYFQSERPLKYFKNYSQKNCNLECLTEFTYDWCWCVSFFMPRENDTEVCGSANKQCMEEAEQILQKGHLSNVLGEKHKRKNSTDSFIEEVPDCDCLPLCTDLSYNVETSSSRWDWVKTMESIYQDNPLVSETKNLSVSNLIIYFKNSQFVTSKRHELFGPTDFLANFGGLLGLFTGFSILSLMEIIYFLTVRIICNIRLYGSWSGSEK